MLPLWIGLVVTACNIKQPAAPEPEQTSPSTTVHVSGNQLVNKDGKPILLKGVAFGNEVWSDNPLPYTHHNEADFARVKAMNMNVIRFYLNYKTFEDDNAPYQYKAAGWEWMNKNIEWAKKHGIYLILNMHVPQGGFQSLGKGGALWDNPENQNRLTALWKEIAKRYANEEWIVGFDLVNEPQTTQSIDQWKNLAQRITTAIREVDKNHVIIVERANAVAGNGNNNENLNFVLVNDANVIYTFHFYGPIEYTHQKAQWAGFGDGGAYPDENRIVVVGNTSWLFALSGNPKLPIGNSNWKYYEGIKYKFNDTRVGAAKVVMSGDNLVGKAFFDEILVKEYDANGTFVRDVAWISPKADDKTYFWAQNNTGSGGFTTETGHNDNAAFYISGTTSYANLNLNQTLFIPKQGYSYQISGWMKGENVAANAEVTVRLDFESGKAFPRNKDYLKAEMEQYVAWGKRNNVPLFFGEYGLNAPCFEDNKGGLLWLGDMIDIFLANEIHSTYHAYHEDNFGIYPGYGTLVIHPKAGRRRLIYLHKNLSNQAGFEFEKDTILVASFAKADGCN